MGPKPHRRLTDLIWLFQYVMANPNRALAYGTLAGFVILVVTVSVAIEAIPIWIGALIAGLTLIAVARESIQRSHLLGGRPHPVDALPRLEVHELRNRRLESVSIRARHRDQGRLDCRYSDGSATRRSLVQQTRGDCFTQHRWGAREIIALPPSVS